jgi:3-methylcrotonyl-CoA carboxylase beta subunit
MSVIRSMLNVRGDEFRANAASMRSLVGDLRDKVVEVVGGGSDEARARHLASGKLLARDRVNALLDPGALCMLKGLLARTRSTDGDRW